MNRNRQAYTLVKIRTVLVIILSALVTSMILELIISERTNALLKETLQETTSLVKQTVAPVLPPAPASTPTVSPPSQASQSKQNPITIANSAPAQYSASPINTVSEKKASPIETTPLLNANLESINYKTAKISNQTPVIRAASVVGATLPSNSFSWLQATGQGWEIFGIVWYWWLAGIVSITVGIIIWQRSLKQIILNKLLSTQHILYAE